jgi:hypothetical protein
MIIALVAWCLASGACGEPERVKFKPYDEDALSLAHTLGKPIVVYATADW